MPENTALRTDVRPTGGTVRRGDVFYPVAWGVAAIIVIAGFAPTYFLRAFLPARPLTMLVHLHGALMTCWFVLFPVQWRLIAASRPDWHRRLGSIGAGVATLIVIVGGTTAVEAQRVGHRPPGTPPEVALYAGVVPLLVFGALVAAAVLLRRQRGAHPRLMLLATLSIVQAAAGRLPLGRLPLPEVLQSGGPFGLLSIDLLLVYACVVWDTWRHRRLHPAYACGLAMLLLVENLLLEPLAGSGAWRDLTHRLVP